jgi:hypothetical protein
MKGLIFYFFLLIFPFLVYPIAAARRKVQPDASFDSDSKNALIASIKKNIKSKKWLRRKLRRRSRRKKQLKRRQ